LPGRPVGRDSPASERLVWGAARLALRERATSAGACWPPDGRPIRLSRSHARPIGRASEAGGGVMAGGRIARVAARACRSMAHVTWSARRAKRGGAARRSAKQTKNLQTAEGPLRTIVPGAVGLASSRGDDELVEVRRVGRGGRRRSIGAVLPRRGSRARCGRRRRSCTARRHRRWCLWCSA